MHEEISFLPLLVISVFAVLVPFLTFRLTGGMLPAVVGEVVIGIVFGEHVLGVITPSEWLDFLALFGFAYLMFLSGLEINLNLLTTSLGPRWYNPRVALRHPLVSGLLFTVLTIAVTYIALRLLQEISVIEAPSTLMLVFIFIATSVGVLVPVLKDRPDLGNVGQAILMGGFLVELVAIVGVGIVAALERTGVGLEMALLVAMPVALGFLVWLAKSGGVRFPIIGRTLQELADTSAQLKIRAALVVMIAFVALSEVVGTELVLGAFLAGLAATVISPKHGSAVRVRLDAMGYGFFVPLFFIHAGATLDFGVAFQSLDAFVIAAVFLFLAFLIKMLPAVLTLSPAHGIRSGLSGGALLSANLSLVIAAGAIAEDLGLIDNEMYGALLLMALLSTVLAPLLFNAISGRAPEPSEGPIVVIGGSPLAQSITHRLASAGRLVSVISTAEVDVHDVPRPDRVMLIPGDPLNERVQGLAGIPVAETVVIADSEPIEQVEAIAAAIRRNHRDLRIVTWLPERNARLEQLEVECILQEESEVGALESALLRPGLYHALSDAESGVVEVAMRNLTIHGRALRELRFAGGVRVLVVRRKGESMVADGDTVLMRGDYVTLGGEPAAVAEVSATLQDRGTRLPLAPTQWSAGS